MIDISFPWWVGLLVLILAFMFYVGIGAILGSLVTYMMLTRSARKGGSRAFRRKSDRIGMSLMMGGFTGALLQYAVVKTWMWDS